MIVLLKAKVKVDECNMTHLLKFFGVPVPKLTGGQLDFQECKKPDFL